MKIGGKNVSRLGLGFYAAAVPSGIGACFLCNHLSNFRVATGCNGLLVFPGMIYQAVLTAVTYPAIGASIGLFLTGTILIVLPLFTKFVPPLTPASGIEH